MTVQGFEIARDFTLRSWRTARFRLVLDLGFDAVRWPERFVIVSAHAPTGAIWTAVHNGRADRGLEAALRAHGGWLLRVVGYLPDRV